MKLLGSEFHGFAKAIVILVAVMLVSVGLCGMGAAGYAVAPAPFRILLAAALSLGALGFWASFLGIPLVLLIWGVSSLLRPSKRPNSTPDGKD